MRTETIKLYSFTELNEDAQQKAIENYRNKDQDNSFYYDEITESVKAVLELFGLKTGRDYSDIRTGHIDDTILELSGIRLYKYLINNYYSDLFKPTYIKSLDREVKTRAFICKVRKDYKGNLYTQIYSKTKVDDCCTLTGVCYDMDILQPVYDFLKSPDKSTTFEDLIKDICESSINKAYRDAEEWLYSEEFIKEELENNDREFTEDGEIY